MNGFLESKYDLDTCQLKKPDIEQARLIAQTLGGIDPWKTLGTSVKGMGNYFATSSEEAQRLAIFRNDEICGIICVKTQWLLGPYLDFLGIFPQAQGTGLGRTVMNWMEEEARKTRARNIFLCVSDFNKDAITFYKSCGYELSATLDGLIVNDHGELLMRKRLF